MADGSSRFTSDRRIHEEASWGDQVDWGAGTAENVDVTATGLVGRSPSPDSGKPESGISRWTFDDADTQSGSAIDVWGGHDGIINGTTAGASGANQTYTTNEAYSFDGDNDHINIGRPAELEFTGRDAFSISLWVHPIDNGDSPDSYRHRVLSNRHSNSNAIEIFVDVDGDTHFTVNGGDRFIATTEFALSLNDWHHLVGTYNGSDTVTMYHDGSFQSDGTGSPGTGSLVSGDWNFGRFPQYPSDPGYYSGGADDIRIFNKDLSGAEVGNLYNTGSISG